MEQPSGVVARRDYGTDMIGVVEAFVPDGDYHTEDVAARIVAYLAVDDPDLLEGWLLERAPAILGRFLSERRRAHLRLANRRDSETKTAFLTAAGEYTASCTAGTPDGSVFSVFEQRLVVSADYTLRAIGQMRRADHLFVAAQHHKRAQLSVKEKLFHDLIAARLPDDSCTTAEALTEDEYLLLRRQVFG